MNGGAWLPAKAGTVVAALVLHGAMAQPAFASNLEQGRRIARLYCAGCHAIDKIGPSPLSIAPTFRSLHTRYPIESLQEALAEGIVTGHPTMPQFRFEPDQIGDLLLFLKSLE